MQIRWRDYGVALQEARRRGSLLVTNVLRMPIPGDDEGAWSTLRGEAYYNRLLREATAYTTAHQFNPPGLPKTLYDSASVLTNARWGIMKDLHRGTGRALTADRRAVWINHYQYKSREEYRQKIQRGFMVRDSRDLWPKCRYVNYCR